MWNGKMKALTFSYDDGIFQDVRLIELFDKYGMKGTFNLNSGLMGKPGTVERCGVTVGLNRFSADEIADVYKNHEIAVHTLTHPTLSPAELTDGEIIRQVEDDRVKLSEISGYEVVGMAYPNGYNDDYVAELIRDNTGIKYSRTVTATNSFDLQDNLLRFNPTLRHADFDDMFSMGKQFLELKSDKPQIYYIWGHTFEFDIADTWGRMEEFLEMMSFRDDIFYGTNKDVILR